ncbi:MAG: PKD domain-containing protein [Bacteroidota bacterium]
MRQVFNNKSFVFIIFLIACQFTYAQFNVDFSGTPTTACVGQSIQFNDLSTPSGSSISWVWDFGDGSSATIQNPSHTYSAAGTYTVILTANNGSGAQDEVKTGYITVHPLPQPSFSVSNPPCSLPATVNISSVQPTSGMTYLWNFGNGQTSTSQNPSSPTYTSEGTFPIVLTVTNTATGCSNTATQNVNIFNYTADFTPSTVTACVGSAVTFTNTSSPGTNVNAWTFGNGQTSSSVSPTIIYSTPGNYTVTLNSQNSSNGCSDAASMNITVVQAQIPTVTPSLTIGCNPSTVSFTNTNSFDGTFLWNFGNGNTFTGENPPPQNYSMPEYDEFPFPQSQAFDVILLSTDNNGCTSFQNFQDLITIYNVFPIFSVDINEGCEVLDVTFSNQSYSPIPGFPINSWQWNFGNGQSYSGQNPPPQSYNEGEYDVSLTVSTAMGCTTTFDSLEMIQVGILPNVLFSVDPDSICARQNADFTNLSSISIPHDPNDVLYEWYIGSQGPFPFFEPDDIPITDTGWVDVTLIVSFRGCRDTLTLEDELFVNAPLVQIGTSGVVCNPTLPADITIYENSILGRPGDSVEVFWSFGDGTFQYYDNDDAWLNNNQSFTHTYTSYGDFQVQQIITNFNTGCADTLATVAVINLFELNLDFAVDSVCHGQPVYFSWNFISQAFYPAFNYHYIADGDSILGYSSNPFEISNPDTCLINSVGLHTITVNAVNAAGCPATVTDTFYVMPLPEAEIGPIQMESCDPLIATFSDASTIVSGIPIVNYFWTLNGFPPSSGNGQPTITSPVSTGDYPVTLLVTDALGCMNSVLLQAEFMSPVAMFNADSVICNNTMFSSSNLSSNFVSSEWYWNGQLMSTDEDANFEISHADNPSLVSYSDTITLVVTDENGCTDSYVFPLLISAPNADFSFDLTGSNVDEFGNFTCPSVFSSFTDESSSIGSIVSWAWDFGDGKFSALQNPSNTYVFSGSYTASLTITDEFGCQDTVVYPDFLEIDGPSGVFDVGPAGTLCDPNYLYEVVSLDNVSSVTWYPGDGNSFSAITGDEYIYASAGEYYPYVIITDDNNCVVTYYLDTLTVQFGNLNAAFDASPILLNWGEPLVIDNQSTGGNGGIVNNNWSFGSENFNNQSDQFSYLFNEIGELQVFLTVTDAIGCIDTAWITVFVTDSLLFPNVFSPNGDGVNDVYRIRENAYGEYDVVIYNRWGNKMSESHIIDDSYLWDGKNNSGEIAEEGVYFYFVKGTLRDGTPKEDHGFFHLVMKE